MRSAPAELWWRIRWVVAAALLCAATFGFCVGSANRKIAALNMRVASLEKDFAREKGFDAVSSDDFAAMRKEAVEHNAKIDAARKIADDAIAQCWADGNIAVDGLDTFIGGRVVCIRPSGGVVSVTEPHWPKDD